MDRIRAGIATLALVAPALVACGGGNEPAGAAGPRQTTAPTAGSPGLTTAESPTTAEFPAGPGSRHPKLVYTFELTGPVPVSGTLTATPSYGETCRAVGSSYHTAAVEGTVGGHRVRTFVYDSAIGTRELSSSDLTLEVDDHRWSPTGDGNTVTKRDDGSGSLTIVDIGTSQPYVAGDIGTITWKCTD